MARPIQKREHIEAGVVEVVAQKGLHATTIQDIARAASVSPGLLYRYWSNRDELAAEVYVRHAGALIAELASVADEGDTWSTLERMLDRFLRFAERRPTILRFLLLSQHDLSRSIPKNKGIRSVLVGVLTQGMRIGDIREMDPDLAAHLALGVVVQPTVGVIYGDVPLTLSACRAGMLEALRRILAPDKSAVAVADSDRRVEAPARAASRTGKKGVCA